MATPMRPAAPAVTPPPSSHRGRPGLTGPTLTAPAFAVLSPSRAKAVFLQHGRSLVLPVFTRQAAAADFLVRARMTRNWILELPTAADAIAFLQAPPGLSAPTAGLLISIDPIDPLRPTGLCGAEEVVAALQTAAPPPRGEVAVVHPGRRVI